jgi:transcriptional regulator with XRE-family HTH domain
MTTTIGNTIKAARIARGLTLQNVAESLGLRSRQQIWEWESGRVCPGPKHLAKLAEVLGLDVLDLLPRESDNAPASSVSVALIASRTSPLPLGPSLITP